MPKDPVQNLNPSPAKPADGASVLHERVRTDDSLRVEREKTDDAVAARQVEIATHAEKVVDLARDTADGVLAAARENADAVLEAAREKADEPPTPHAGGASPEAIVSREREIADEAVREERVTADETLREEREEYARTAKKFLPLERESTDRYLKSERVYSDDALANRDDFLAIVSHDLRDLIGGIVMSATLIAKISPSGDKDVLAETGRIKRYAARMNRLIGDLVDVASIDAGKLAIVPSPGDCAAVILEAEDAFRATAADKGVSIDVRTTDGTPHRAAFDHDRVLQVLANLVSNSLKYTPRGGKVSLASEVIDGMARLSVTDTGSGIPAGALEAVFERFAQAGGGDRRGLGLGLYISRCIIEAHGGKIWAESMPEGSKICFTLPLAG